MNTAHRMDRWWQWWG